MRVLSFGGGVQTTAAAILAVTGAMPRPDAIVFADTGDESPETYAFMGGFVRWLADQGFMFVRVRRAGPDLVTRYTRAGRMPMRSVSSCTDNFKIQPVRRWMRANGCATSTHRSKNKPTVQIGISWDEMDRMADSDVKWIRNEYPLIDLRLNRDDCKKIIAAAGFEVPPKSGCMCCPWQSARALVRANEQHPKRIERVAAMEARAIERTPQHRLVRSDFGTKLTVPQILAAAAARIPLFDISSYEQPGCKTAGHCFK
jgi:3'-phosphoadenosine 5'-phosphosulfate sulfotransferase (PAPS reductase)/FAD synthetase